MVGDVGGPCVLVYRVDVLFRGELTRSPARGHGRRFEALSNNQHFLRTIFILTMSVFVARKTQKKTLLICTFVGC